MGLLRPLGGAAAAMAIGICSALSACSDANPDGTAGTEVTAVVGPGGGEVALDGLRLTIPAGALATETPITIARSGAPPDEYDAYGPTYRFGPDGLEFSVPAAIRFSRSAGDEPLVYWTTPLDPSAFEALDSNDDGTHTHASVSHFSRGFVGAPKCRPRAECKVGPSCTRELVSCAKANGAVRVVRSCACRDGQYACDTTNEKCGPPSDAGVDASPDARDGGCVLGRSWAYTGPMSTARSIFGAVSLADGKVLVVGGFGGGPGGLASAEVFDPVTRTFTPTGSLEHKRTRATATRLQNGDVIVIGGHNNVAPQYLAPAELYVPATGVFSTKGDLATGRYGHTATLLGNGKVLVAGGIGFDAYAMSSAELYDPSTGTFGATGSLTTRRYHHTATPLPSGRILIAGGIYTASGESAVPLASAEIYDPVTGTFTPTGSMLTGRVEPSAVALADGKVVVIGGNMNNGTNVRTAEIYDPSTGTFSAGGTMNSPHWRGGATLLPDGSVLVVGGVGEYIDGGGGYQPLASTEILDPIARSFSAGPSLNATRSSHHLFVLPEGNVLAVGGNSDLGYLSSAETLRVCDE